MFRESSVQLVAAWDGEMLDLVGWMHLCSCTTLCQQKNFVGCNSARSASTALDFPL